MVNRCFQKCDYEKERIIMRFVISVIDTQTRPPHSPEEIAAIDAFNDKLVAAGQRIFAGGLESPSDAAVIDNRSGANIQTVGPFYSSPEYFGGFWIIDVPTRELAEELAAEGSLACNRKVELRPLIG
jgi:hypothetical protein